MKAFKRHYTVAKELANEIGWEDTTFHYIKEMMTKN